MAEEFFDIFGVWGIFKLNGGKTVSWVATSYSAAVDVAVHCRFRTRAPAACPKRTVCQPSKAQATCAWNLTPSALATFRTVAKLGLPFSPSALYKLSRLSPASRAT